MYGKSYKVITVEMTVEDAISYAFSDVEQLASEMRDWSDNMAENLKSGSKGEAVEECADQLEAHTELDSQPPESFASTKITVSHGVKRSKSASASRPARLGNAIQSLRAVQELADERAGEIDPDDESKTEEERKALEEEKVELEALSEAIEEVASEWEGIDIPGMYG